MSAPLCVSNGQWIPQAELKLPLHDAGFVLGATVTDLCRTFRHQPFRLPEHLERFGRSYTSARIPQPVPLDELARLAVELIRHNAQLLPPARDLAFLILATPGPIGYYAGQAGGAGEGKPTLILTTFPLTLSRFARLFTEGASLVIPSIRQVPPAILDARIKHRSRLTWWLAEQQAHDVDPTAAALPLDEAGHVTETAGANLLVVRHGTVFTPPRANVLDGISLRVTQELCGRLNIPFAELPLSPPDCQSADEMMLTSTPYGVAGVRRLQGTKLPWPGPIFERLFAAWNELVGLDIRAQILRGP